MSYIIYQIQSATQSCRFLLAAINLAADLPLWLPCTTFHQGSVLY
ncbi:hypothetical protein VCHE16_2878 [Vibrio paracholerae HE-16]|nr:hypothetical protein VCHE09_2533 [Vibrio paracholerae HE-09]EKG85237.1 hypothetical protein VCHE16_2878 [Vibrio paracholerae HE-16]EMP91231.1 hypothetical protein VC87395_002690 [Vibrio paracholerae 87395]